MELYKRFWCSKLGRKMKTWKWVNMEPSMFFSNTQHKKNNTQQICLLNALSTIRCRLAGSSTTLARVCLCVLKLSFTTSTHSEWSPTPMPSTSMAQSAWPSVPVSLHTHFIIPHKCTCPLMSNRIFLPRWSFCLFVCVFACSFSHVCSGNDTTKCPFGFFQQTLWWMAPPVWATVHLIKQRWREMGWKDVNHVEVYAQKVLEKLNMSFIIHSKVIHHASCKPDISSCGKSAI